MDDASAGAIATEDRRGCSRSRWITLGLAMIVIVPALVLGSTVAALNTDWGLTKVRDLVTDGVTKQIPGTLEIGSVEDIRLFAPLGTIHVVVGDLRFADPDDHAVIEVENAEVQLPVVSLLTGTVEISQAYVGGGVVTIEDDNGRTRLENAFDDPDKTIGDGAMGIELRRLSVQEITLVVHPSPDKPDKTVRFEQIKGSVDVLRIGDAKAVTVKLYDVSGVLTKPALLGLKVALTGVSGEVRGKAKEVIELDVNAKVAGTPLSGKFRFVPGDEKAIKLSVTAEGNAAKLAGTIAQIGTDLGGNVDLTVNGE